MHHKTRQKRVTCSSKSVHRVIVWVEGWHPLRYQDRFCLLTIDLSIVRAVPVLTFFDTSKTERVGGWVGMVWPYHVVKDFSFFLDDPQFMQEDVSS